MMVPRWSLVRTGVRRLRKLMMLTALAATAGACAAAGAAVPGTAPAAATPAPPAPQALPKACLDAPSGDSLTREFMAVLKKTLAASGALSLASTPDACDLQLHVPGNLLRFETAGGVMVSTAVIVTSPSGRYLSSSLTACRASDLKPCALRAITVAKLALLVRSDEETDTRGVTP